MQWLYQSDRAAVHFEFRKDMRLLRRVLEARPNYARGWISMMQLAVNMSDFPELVALLERERINRPPALPIPFACQ
jgi:hypothetical protein